MNRFFKCALCFILTFAVLLPMCACEDDQPHPEDEIIEYILTEEPLSLDPQIASDYSSVMLIRNLFEGLVRESADGSIVGGNAESFVETVDSSRRLGATLRMVRVRAEAVLADEAGRGKDLLPVSVFILPVHGDIRRRFVHADSGNHEKLSGFPGRGQCSDPIRRIGFFLVCREKAVR